MAERSRKPRKIYMIGSLWRMEIGFAFWNIGYNLSKDRSTYLNLANRIKYLNTIIYSLFVFSKLWI